MSADPALITSLREPFLIMDLLTDEEYQHLIVQAVTGKPQTKRQIYAVIKLAERIKIESLMLEAVMKGKLLMFYDKGKLVVKKVK